jgi:CubicO group peptidase (beta-lactamase class C family)
MDANLDAVLRWAVESGRVPQLAVLVADDSGVVYQGVAGPRAAGSDEPLAIDSVFRIASMTKMVTTVTALQLSERGTLDLDAPVASYLPVFADLQVLVGFDTEGDEADEVAVLRPPVGTTTVRHLVTHTSGLAYWFWNAELRHWEQLTGNPNVMSGHEGTFRAPMVCDPGSRFEYGISTDWLGRVIEVVTGQSLDAVVEDVVTGPLGMAETTFSPDARLRSRLVPVHFPTETGGWTASTLDWNPVPDWWAGGHGLYSTPGDYLVFQRMLLGGGAVDGVRILAEDTVAEAFRNQLGTLSFPAHIATADPGSSADVDLGPGLTWGLGLLLNTERQPGLRHPGSGGWSGIYNTHFWVDPTARLTVGFYTQLLPFAHPGAMATYRDVERAVYAQR